MIENVFSGVESGDVQKSIEKHGIKHSSWFFVLDMARLQVFHADTFKKEGRSSECLVALNPTSPATLIRWS